MKNTGYVESVLPYLRGKFVEIYTGSSAKTRKYSDFDQNQKEVIRGILKDGSHDLLILEVTDRLGNSNNVYINGWAVRAIVEPQNSISIIDVYVDEHEKQDK